MPAQKTFDAVLVDLAGLVEVRQRSITLTLNSSTDFLHASQVVDAVGVDVAVLAKLGQGSVTGDLVWNAVFGIAVLVGLAVGVNLAGRATGRLGGRPWQGQQAWRRQIEWSSCRRLEIGEGDRKRSKKPESVKESVLIVVDVESGRESGGLLYLRELLQVCPLKFWPWSLLGCCASPSRAACWKHLSLRVCEGLLGQQQ